jgi:hypothetical protein
MAQPANPYNYDITGSGYETKKQITKQTRCTPGQNKYWADTSFTQQAKKGTRATLATNASLTQTPQNPYNHPAGSNKHHLQQQTSGKELTP